MDKTHLPQTQTNGSTSTLLVSGIANAQINQATFSYDSGVLTIAGTNLITLASTNDINNNLLTLIGDGGQHTLDTYLSTVTNNNQFIITLNSNDIDLVRNLLNNLGNQSNNGTDYRLTASSSFNGLASLLDTASITVIILPSLIS